LLDLNRLHRSEPSKAEIEAEIERQIRAQNTGFSDEVIAKLVNSVSRDFMLDVKRRISVRRRLLVAAVFVSCLVAIVPLFLSRGSGAPFVEKAPIQAEILNAIVNNADIDALKLVFATRSHPGNGLVPLLRPREFYASSEAHLLSVLNDLKVGVLTRSAPPSDAEKALLVRIDQLIVEYTKINPFEGLEENQKRDLSNIARKVSPDEYAMIAEDVGNVVVELRNKNALVSKYLNSSDISLWLSIVALVVTVAGAFWQYRPKARKTQKELIQEALVELDGKRLKERSGPENGMDAAAS